MRSCSLPADIRIDRNFSRFPPPPTVRDSSDGPCSTAPTKPDPNSSSCPYFMQVPPQFLLRHPVSPRAFLTRVCGGTQSFGDFSGAAHRPAAANVLAPVSAWPWPAGFPVRSCGCGRFYKASEVLPRRTVRNRRPTGRYGPLPTSTCRRTLAHLRRFTFCQAADCRLKIPHNGEFAQIVRNARCQNT